MLELYKELGIEEKVYRFGQQVEDSLKERFAQMDQVTEYNQLKVIKEKQSV